jgi:AAA ATPase domain
VRDRQPLLDVFVGRATELARVAEVITRVEGGEPWLVSIEGDPGVGKTALARRCLAGTPGLRVLSARADQAEADLDFGIVDQLLRAAGAVFPTFPSAGATGSPESSFALGAHLLEVVGDQQATAAVAIVVDDLQWADRRSIEALTFVLRRLSVDPVLIMLTYRGPGDQLDEAAQQMLRSVDNRLDILLGGLSQDEVAALAAAVTAGPLDGEAVQWLYRGTGGHALYLRTVLSEGFHLDPRVSGRLALPRSLAAAVGDYVRVLPPETRVIVEMLSVLNLRMPLAKLGQAAQVDSPSTAIEPAVNAGLVDWWPAEPTCPVEIRHLLVRDAVYAGIPATRRRVLHERAASVVSESASWEHRVAALDHPDEGLAAELERLAGEEVADGRLARAATHLRWASDISPAVADRERRMLTAAMHLMLAEEAAASVDYKQEGLYAAMARALVCQATGDYLGMAETLDPWADDAALDGRSRMDAVLWRTLLAEGLIGSGQAAKAAVVLAQLRADNSQVSYLQPAVDWLDGWLAELKGAPEQAREIYQRGQDTADTRSPVYTARLLLAHGWLLRRTGNRRDAVERLRRANTLFSGLRATPFIARTEQELAACHLPSARPRSSLCWP